MRKSKYLLVAGPTPVPARTAEKFWSMAEVGEDEAEITLYGEIVSRRPVDWWTGEPEPGMFISPEGFLEDLEQIRGKSKVTIRLNSIGGDLYTGMAIYSQLKSLAAEKTVIIDGIAASAASVIAMAGDTILLPVGGTVMIHEAAVVLCDRYGSSAIKGVSDILEAANKCSAEVYAEKTGTDVKAIRSMMAKTTWMIGQEAIDKGFATGLLAGDGPTMSLSADRRTLMVGGIKFSTEGLPGIPQSIPVMRQAPLMAAQHPAAKPENIQPTEGGKSNMEITAITTVEALRGAFPVLVLEIETAVRTAATTESTQAERTRISQIDEIAPLMDAELVKEAKYGEKTCTAPELSFRALQLQSQLGAQQLAAAAKDNGASGAKDVRGVAPAPEAGSEAADVQEILEVAKLYNSTTGGVK